MFEGGDEETGFDGGWEWVPESNGSESNVMCNDVVIIYTCVCIMYYICVVVLYIQVQVQPPFIT